MRFWPFAAAVSLLALVTLPLTRPALAQGAALISKAVIQAQGGDDGQGGAGQAGGAGTTGTTGQAGGDQGTAAPPSTGAAAPPERAAKPATEIGRQSSNSERSIGRYGEEVFIPSRLAILAAREKIAQGNSIENAYTAPSGPTPLGNINATPPETYQLGPGDRLTLRVSSTFNEAAEGSLQIDAKGGVVIPQSGRRVVLRGMTVGQAENALKTEIATIIRNPQVQLTLNELRTFTVTVLGESFAPGSYQVPATFGIFNLILATGGPTLRGTLRDIQLRRNNSTAQSFDLYKFLISGLATQDLPLQPGDVIYFPLAKGMVSVEGEVNRPSVFEILGGETLKQILDFAGGIRPSAVAQNVAIDSVVPGVERRLLNVNLSGRNLSANPVVSDGDKVQVFSIRPIIRNQVVISGPVEQPRAYAYKAGMRVSDLVEAALGLRPEADITIAELRRVNGDGTTQLHRVNLKEAMSKTTSANLELKADDTLTIFDINDISWRGERRVSLSGAVRDPGNFYRADNMRVGDLIRQGKGLQPDAFTQEAHLQRTNKDGTPGALIKISPLKAAMGDPGHDILLEDRDTLTIYKITDWTARPRFAVQIKGSVQRPESYPLSQGMKVKDLIELSGGFALDSHTKDAFLQRVNTDGTLGQLLLISPSEALKGDPRHNLELQAGDTLTLYSIKDWKATPDQTVEVTGAVQRPGAFGLAKGMKVKELVSLAGGPSLNAYLDTAFLQRVNTDGTLGALQTIDLNKAMADDPVNNVELSSRDTLTVYTNEKAKFLVERTVTILGGVQRPGTYQRGEGMTLKNLLDLAGGLLPNAEPHALIAAANALEGTNVQKVTVGQSDTWLIKDKDTVTVPLNAAIMAEPIQVIIQGAVRNPGVYFFTRRDQTITDLIEAAGGLRKEAWVKGAQMSRKPELLKTDTQKAQGPRLMDVIRLIQEEEYKRAIARAEVDRLIFISSSLQGNTTSTTVPTGAGTGLQSTPPIATESIQTAELVTKARTANLESLLGGNMEISLSAALKNPNSPHNVALKGGDVLTIPEIPATIMIDGPGVALPRAFVFEKGRSLRDYLNMAGGFTSDADPSSVLVIRPGGSIFKAGPSTRMELGDAVLVPTKVMIVKMGSQREAFDRTVRTISNAALVYGFFKSLTR